MTHPINGPRPDLTGVYTKLVRAYQKLSKFHRVMAGFIDGEPHTVEIESDPNPDLVQVLLRFLPFPPELAILAGEFAHHLRSALDHLAWQLVIDAGGQPNGYTAFPIALDPLDRNGKPRQPPQIAPLVSDEVAAFVADCQPYLVASHMDPATHKLGGLAQLNNFDKHRELAVIRTGILEASYVVYSPQRGLIKRGNIASDATEARTILTKLARSRLTPDVHVQILGHPAAALDAGGNTFAIARPDTNRRDALSQIIESVVASAVNPLIGMMKRL